MQENSVQLAKPHPFIYFLQTKIFAPIVFFFSHLWVQPQKQSDTNTTINKHTPQSPPPVQQKFAREKVETMPPQSPPPVQQKYAREKVEAKPPKSAEKPKPQTRTESTPKQSQQKPEPGPRFYRVFPDARPSPFDFNFFSFFPDDFQQQRPQQQYQPMNENEKRMSEFISQHGSCYDILDLENSANENDIARAYRRKALLYHPDKNPGAADQFKLINDAKEILLDKNLREIHDKYIAAKISNPHKMHQKVGRGF